MVRDTHQDLPAAIAAWAWFLKCCFRDRLSPDRFAALVPVHFTNHRYPLPPVFAADALLRPTEDGNSRHDPLALAYLTHLLEQQRVDTASVLRALLKYSTIHVRVQGIRGTAALAGHGANKEGDATSHGDGTQKKRQILRWKNSYHEERLVLSRLARAVKEGTAIKRCRSVVEVAKVLARWMPLLAEAADDFSRDPWGTLNGPQGRATYRTLQGLRVNDETERSRKAFIVFLAAFSDNTLVRHTLRRRLCRGTCKLLSDALRRFMPWVMQVSPDLATRLDLFRTETLCKHLPTDKKEADEALTYMDGLINLDNAPVPDVPVVNSRAGLYIYLSAALVGRPMIDDSALFAYLHNRYQGDLQSTAVQLILASFDLLANAVFRNEGPKTGHLLKSFVVNKVPLILVSLVSMSSMYPFNAEMCITEALRQVDTNVFPTLSGMFEMSNTNSSFHDSVRQDFCFACQLHGLLSPAATESLLGDITYQSLPDEGRYVKETLVQSCLQDVDRTLKLIGELDNMNGNVGAAAQAIIEVIGSLCRNRETMTLKHLCSQLAAKPLSLDVLLLFDRPQKILHPLCELLDNWAGYEEDQGEYQPVYEEFGSILLLLLAFAYRYSLSPAALGIRSPDSFIGKLLSGGSLYRPLEELNEQEKSHLNGWIHGLFDPEAGGLGDDLMASCPPQDFYLLMPTLFHQIAMGLSAGHLTDDMLKGGLEYLVGVLLLPSLVPALLYLSNQLWVSGPQIQPAIIKILQVIVRPSSISGEASNMLSSVLNIVAKPLEHDLRSYQRQDPKCQEVEPLLRAIKENLELSRRTGGADHTELESWCGTYLNNGINGAAAHSGLPAAVRHTVQSLVQWAQHPPLNGMPATYTHRQTLAAVKMLGAKRVLSVLLDELKSLTDTPQAGTAYDVVTTLICAPDVTNDTSLASSSSSSSSPLSHSASSHSPTANRTAAAAAAAGSSSPPGSAATDGRLSLRQALKAEADYWKRIRKTDAALSDAVVRLHRRVEAQTAPPPPAPSAEDEAAAVAAATAAMLSSTQPHHELGGLGVGSDAAALEDALAAAAAAGVHDGMCSIFPGLKSAVTTRRG
ncbi:Med5-domain-containing protein [Parathielavia hyrcaniae]|uniref:Mediator of RNA polymerase II transcription subunit 5 n=1 Tax=Parathielavia hyrcaniae TaxID=113614 RepID=A0AAN6Q5D8_9PEZI|nr:Med5-domain-containing protein [Parathielavia hyrcaniae]